jgi:hypothetical protein
MSADRGDLSGLLYLPGEQLVRSTVDGDAAEWTESMDYVPSDALVDRVLRRTASAENRGAPVFRFPLSIEQDAWAQRQPIGRKRAASAVAAILGVSPSVLAAATVVHVFAFALFGQWVFQQVDAAAAIPSPVAPAVRVTGVVYWRLMPPQATPSKSTLKRALRLTARPAQVAVTGTGFGGVGQTDTTTIGFSNQRELALRAEQNRRAQRQLGGDTGALRQEFVLEGNDLQPNADGRRRLEVLIRVLQLMPGARVRVLGAGPVASPADSMRKGSHEAESFVRLLLRAGVDVGRLETGQIPLPDQSCSELEPLCIRGRSRVRTEIVRP